jgi:hypothetical protein
MPVIYQEVRVSIVPDYSAVLEIIPRGNDRDYQWTVSPILTTDAVTDAYFRVNQALTPFTMLFEKHITTVLVGGQGQITDTGSVTGIAVLKFQLTKANTLLCAGGTALAPTEHRYAIEIQTASGKRDEFEQGVLPVIEEIVVAP